MIETAKALGPIDAVVAHSYGCTAAIVALAQGLEARGAVMIASPIPRTRERPPCPDREVDAPPDQCSSDEALALRAEGEEKRREQVEAMLRAMTILWP